MNFDFNNTLGVGLRVFALFIPIIVIYTSILTVASKKLNFLQKLGIIIVKVIAGNAKRVYLNDKVVKKFDIKINEDLDIVRIDDEVIKSQKYVYLILNKPTGYVSATKDGKDKTVLDLVPEEYKWRNLFPAGRLDKNTTGMMLITDDRSFCT